MNDRTKPTKLTFSLNGERYYIDCENLDDADNLYWEIFKYVGIKNMRTNQTSKPKAIKIDRQKWQEVLNEKTKKICP